MAMRNLPTNFDFHCPACKAAWDFVVGCGGQGNSSADVTAMMEGTSDAECADLWLEEARELGVIPSGVSSAAMHRALFLFAWLRPDLNPAPTTQARFQRSTLGLVEDYRAPVPSQFAHMPRAMARSGWEWSVAAYSLALSRDCIAWTGGGLDAPLP